MWPVDLPSTGLRYRRLQALQTIDRSAAGALAIVGGNGIGINGHGYLASLTRNQACVSRSAAFDEDQCYRPQVCIVHNGPNPTNHA